MAQIMNSLLPNSDLNWKVGKTTRPFRYDLNQIPYDYTVEVTDRFKELDLIDRVREFGIKVLKYYGYKNIDKILKKSDFHEFYWVFEEILYGYEYKYQEWIDEGLSKIKELS